MSFLHQHISLFFFLFFFSQHGRHSQSVCFTSKTGRGLKLWHWLMHWKHHNPQPVASPLHNAQRTEDKTGDTRDGVTTLQLKCIHGAPSVGGREPRTCQSHSSTFIFKVLNNIQQRFDEREREKKIGRNCFKERKKEGKKKGKYDELWWDDWGGEEPQQLQGRWWVRELKKKKTQKINKCKETRTFLE